MKRWEMPQKPGYEKFYVHEKILRTRNCGRKFIINFLPEKRKENMQTKQPRFKSRLNKCLKQHFLLVRIRSLQLLFPLKHVLVLLN